jgi:hypothetical protein
MIYTQECVQGFTLSRESARATLSILAQNSHYLRLDSNAWLCYHSGKLV